jgi:hypothetical protein
MQLSDIISSDVFHREFPNEYRKIDALVFGTPLAWKGTVIHPPEKNTWCLVTGHSDYPITDALFQKYAPGSWWGINKETRDPRVHAIPLGLVPPHEAYPHTKITGDMQIVLDIQREVRCIKNLVYMNFDTKTYPVERQYVYDLFCNKPWVTKGTFDISLDGRRQFLRDLRNHTFVLCPRGNGVDTHRLWETLYMESIPIVRRHVAMEDFYDMPICFIDSWEEVTPEFLEAERIRIQTGRFNTEKLKAGYWIQKIKRFAAS